MNSNDTLKEIKEYLYDDDLSSDIKLSMMKNRLSGVPKLYSVKSLLMEQAINSGGTEFALIGRVNTSGLELMVWCDDAQNFDCMCPTKGFEDIKDGEYIKRTYTLEELPNAIDNAEKWDFHNRENNHFYNTTTLHIIKIK